MGGLAGFCHHRKRVVGLSELGFVDTLLFSPCRNKLGGVEALLFDVDRIEHFFMELIDHAHAFYDVVQTLLRLKIRPKRHRRAPQYHVFGHFFGPCLEHGLKIVAMRAAVPEKLHHLDFSGGSFYRSGFVKQQIVGALLRRFALRMGCGRQCRSAAPGSSSKCCG